MKLRDEFPQPIKSLLASRVGYKCSNCRVPTIGPNSNPLKATNIGVASHITAAAPNGPRYDHSLTPAQRKDISNGIWLCQKCAKLIDSDTKKYSKELILTWRETAEKIAEAELGQIEPTPV